MTTLHYPYNDMNPNHVPKRRHGWTVDKQRNDIIRSNHEATIGRILDFAYDEQSFRNCRELANDSLCIAKLRRRYNVHGTILGRSEKVDKGDRLDGGSSTRILYLRPAYKRSCPGASAGCARACLGHSSGRLQMSTSQKAQAWKTDLLLSNPLAFIHLLVAEIHAHARTSKRNGLRPVVRLQGSSDYGFEFIDGFEELVHSWGVVQYEYTKVPRRQTRHIDLTFSRSEANEATAIDELKRGTRIAVVVESAEALARWISRHELQGIPVVSGDESDHRYLDPSPSIVVLSPKGAKAKADTSGFIIR